MLSRLYLNTLEEQFYGHVKWHLHNVTESRRKSNNTSLLRCGLDDITVSGVGDGQHAHPVQLTTCSAQFHIVARVLVHTGFGKHGIVLHL